MTIAQWICLALFIGLPLGDFAWRRARAHRGPRRRRTDPPPPGHRRIHVTPGTRSLRLLREAGDPISATIEVPDGATFVDIPWSDIQ